jgi:hypothetical protein
MIHALPKSAMSGPLNIVWYILCRSAVLRPFVLSKSFKSHFTTTVLSLTYYLFIFSSVEHITAVLGGPLGGFWWFGELSPCLALFAGPRSIANIGGVHQ